MTCNTVRKIKVIFPNFVDSKIFFKKLALINYFFMEYNPNSFKADIDLFWENNQVYKVENESSKPKFYVLDMFPYPSGAGLHVGHPLGYIASDIFARFKRLQGFNVLHPIGYDSFGLPAEQYAIQTGVHPADSTKANIATFKSQLKKIGFSYDWTRELMTSDPNYYKWTQWIFLELFNHFYNLKEDKANPISDLITHFEMHGSHQNPGFHTTALEFSPQDWKSFSEKQKEDILMNFRLVYRTQGTVNWCEELGTVLANDEIKDGVSERGGFPVTKKAMMQWSLRTSAYAQRLLDGLNQLDWSEALKTMQTHWIGRSEGASLSFEVKDSNIKIPIYTTRPDTIFGATFVVLAPDHDLVSVLINPEVKESVSAYQEFVKSKSDRERADGKSISGVFTGSYAINPFTHKPIPIWIADYVLKDYGTGAIMAVPSNDDRDMAFAQHFDLPIVEVIDQSDFPEASRQDKVGKLQHSDFLNGMDVAKAIKEILKAIEEKGLGTRKVNYRLRDANYSRQRYWGEPFPIFYDEKGLIHALDIHDPQCQLPPVSDYKPTTGGKAPLNNNHSWVHFAEGKTMETDTMPGFAGSSWYFLRYMDPQNDNEAFSKKAIDYWQSVDLYLGGSEHAVGHLLYSRMWHKFLYDIGKVPTDEPFKKLINQGMIQGVSAKIWTLKNPLQEVENLISINDENIAIATSQQVFVSADIIDDIKALNPSTVWLLGTFPLDFVSDYSHNMHVANQEGVKSFEKWKGGNHIFLSRTNEFYLVSEVEKMSKSKYNVINPDDIVEKYGADCFRMYEMFLGPIEQAKPWDMQGIDGVNKFLRRFWTMFYDDSGKIQLSDAAPSKEEDKIINTCIKKVNEDIEKFSLNTCVSSFMICVNELKKIQSVNHEVLRKLNILLAPFAPYITEHIWRDIFGEKTSIHALPDGETSRYPLADESKLVADNFDYPICINGKKRAILSVAIQTDNKTLESLAVNHEDIVKWLDTPIKKVIIVPQKMINIVI
jgi:leucyl-tRNA synthetase